MGAPEDDRSNTPSIVPPQVLGKILLVVLLCHEDENGFSRSVADCPLGRLLRLLPFWLQRSKNVVTASIVPDLLPQR